MSYKEAIIAIYGSHNATVSLAINNKIVEVVEIERLVGKKNASLFFYPPTLVKNPESTLAWIKDYFLKKYNVEDYSICYHDVCDLDIVKKIFKAKEYKQTNHHINHACSSFYQSNHNEALVLSFDGGGNDGWFNLYHAKRGEDLKLLHYANINFGVCYSMVGHYIKELKHENDYLIGNLVYAGKLMGLAGYGSIRHEWLNEFDKWYELPTGVDHINLIKDTFRNLNINLEEDGLVSSNNSKDLAATNQYAFENNTIKIIKPYLDQYSNLPLHITGGGGLNILLNTRLAKEREVFVSPNPSDCGLSVGMLCNHIRPNEIVDITYAGPEVFDKDSLLDYTESYETTTDIDHLINDLVKGKIVGVVRGGCEHGPRALGNRSIICNPSFPEMKDTLNAKVKHREWYRPFAPVVRLEDVNEYFDLDKESRWMNYCPQVKPEYKEKLAAITHIDGTARVQTVTKEQNEWLYNLLTEFKKKSGIGVLLNTSFNVDGKPILNTYKDAFYVFNNSEMDGLFLDNTYVTKESLSNKLSNSKLTVVTGLWNLNRPGRDFSQYIEQFEKLLDFDCNLFIHIPKEYEYIVWKKRKKHNTHVRIYELDDVKNMYGEFWDKTQAIRTNPDWYNLTGEQGWLKNSPQAALEWYNPIVMSKYSMLHNVTIWNPFNSEYFLWLDAGITFTVYEKFFTESNILDKIVKYMDPFLFLSYPYDAVDEIHGFKYKDMNRYAQQDVKYVCRGGLFGGHIDTIREGNGTYWHLLNRSLNEGLMGTEESIFTIMSYLEPEKYRRYALDSNGLIVKFIQSLMNDNIELEPIPNNRVYLKPKVLDTSKLKTSLYMLTFNFPEQVRHTLETYKKNQPEFLSKTRKILIDNSNKPEAIEGNKLICEEYGFEHIITGENLGINRGRQYAAEHFQNSDSDYYIFLEDDMGVYGSEDLYCRNGFKHFIPNLYDTIHKIMLKEEYDFLKLSYTEVYMDNNIQVSWYNVPQNTRTELWPHYDKLPIQGLDPNAPRTQFNKIDVLNGVSYVDGEIYYTNWPMIVGKTGNQKMFLDTTWAHPYEQTWMSYMFQKTRDGNLKPAVLLASPIKHNRISHYDAHERREN